MSGHSKWKTIQHKKGAADAKRGKVFSKMSKEIMVAARAGGSDIELNAGLRNIVQKAKSVNMPADNIDRAIKKGAGELDGVTFEEVVYEGYAGGGVGIVVKALTDNKNRAASEIRHIFTKNNSSFASQGAVSRNFQRKGQIMVDTSTVDEDTLMALVLDAGAEDMVVEGDNFEILTEPEVFSDVTDALEGAGIATLSAEVTMLPLLESPVEDLAVARGVFRFVDMLEDNDDVQEVYMNMSVSDELMEQLAEED
ncbi:MAG: YebC/PmpR family DNA-binding transcriptional regulator [Kiritimatiellae bacterium]|jgi:YebC/PmpR family DNA-binding regulatory protein|nr:YebC/PmpR family DNA-binding transcriptional regulator [Kiritimatiellia bacterium]